LVLGAKYRKAVPRLVQVDMEEDEINIIRDRLRRRIREPDVRCEWKETVDVHALQKKLSKRLKKQSYT
jgi:hypothetical protein